MGQFQMMGLSGAHGREELPRSSEDPVKAAAAKIFKQKWDEAKSIPNMCGKTAISGCDSAANFKLDRRFCAP